MIHSEPIPQKDDSPLRRRLASLILIGTTVFSLGRVCTFDFTWWDDDSTVHHNPWLNPPTIAAVAHFWTTPGGGIYIPMTYMVWAGIAAIAKVQPDAFGIAQNPWLFHTANLFVHLIGVFIAARILRLLGATLAAATAGALVFAVHPVQVEAVAWVSGLKDVLSGTLALTATWFYLRHAVARANGRTSAWFLAWASGIFVLAMLSKSGVMAMPLLVAALDRWVVGRSWNNVARSAGLLLAFAVPIAVTAKLVQDQSLPPATRIYLRPFIAADALAFYLYKLVVPLRLCIDYGRSPSHVIEQGVCFWDWIAPATIGIALVLKRSKYPVLLAAAISFLAGCLPIIGLMNSGFQILSTTTDHYLYLSMLGPALAVAWVLSNHGSKKVFAVAGIWIALLAAVSFRQTSVWRNDASLFTHCTEVNPNSYVAWIDLAGDDQRNHRLPEAASLLRRAIAIAPEFPVSHSNLGDVLDAMGDAQAAIDEKRISVQLQKQYPRWRMVWPDDLETLGNMLIRAGRKDEGISSLREALDITPWNQTYRRALETATSVPASAPASRPTH